MFVRDLPTIVGIEIGKMQRLLNDDRRDNYRNTYRNRSQRNQVNQEFENRNRIDRNDCGFESCGGQYQFRNRSTSDNFNQDSRNGGTRGDNRLSCSQDVKGRYNNFDLKRCLMCLVVLCRKNNGLPPDNPEAYGFAVDYPKLNAITKYPRYPLPLIEDLITNIPHTNIMRLLDLRSGYFQLAVNPSDVVKTAFITKNGTYAFQSMPFGLSGAGPNFQKAIDIILRTLLGKYMSVYMDDIILSPSFAHHVEHLKEVLKLLQEAGLTLNKGKCNFGCKKLKYLGLVIGKDEITTDESKVKAIIEMKPPKNSREVWKFLGMNQWHQKFIKNYADLCELLYQLKKKSRNLFGQRKHRLHLSPLSRRLWKHQY
ncbi:retrovirus-related Pol polyprotein from transposon opus [Trichonephila clavipes]|nr:retrovirus-related Pol polyprotein from transposon opus [Trichonephila clavipes]